MNVLLIEDSCPVTERLAEIFSGHHKIAGFTSVKSQDFTSAIMCWRAHQIILVGVSYPLTTSFNLLKQVALLHPAAIIMLDNGTDEYIHRHFLKHGATHVIDTYNDFGQLLQIVEQMTPSKNDGNNLLKNCSDE